MNDPKPKMTPAEFVDAVNELAKMTGKSPVILAGALSSNVRLEEPPADLSRIDLRGYAHALAQFTAEHRCSASIAIAHVRAEDYVRGAQ